MQSKKTRIWNLATLEANDLRRLAGGRAYGRGKQPADGMFATRLVPIESLLKHPAPVSAPSEAAAPEPEPAAPAARPARWLLLSATHARRGLMALLGLFAMGVWLVGSLRSGVPVAPVPRLPTVPAAPASHALQPAHEASPAHAHSARVGLASLDPRRAVDALAAGDLVAAQRMYSALARSVDGPSAYAEAARILDERLRGGRP